MKKLAEKSIWTYFIVDDHPLFRQGLQSTLSASKRLSFVGEAGNLTEALKYIPSLKPDFVILDHGLQNQRTGLELIETLKNFEGQFILVTQCEDPAALRSYKDYGIKAMVSKINAADDLLKAFQSLYQDQTFITATIEKLLNLPDPSSNLTPREIEVVRHIAQGKTNKEVASMLSCSDETIKTHKANIMRKLNINSSVEIGVWAIRNGLVVK